MISVPVYEWMLPEDLSPLRSAIIASEVDVALFTSSAQVRHLFQIAGLMGLQNDLAHLKE